MLFHVWRQIRRTPVPLFIAASLFFLCRASSVWAFGVNQQQICYDGTLSPRRTSVKNLYPQELVCLKSLHTLTGQHRLGSPLADILGK